MKRRHLSKPTNAIRAIAGACLAAAFAAAPDASAAPAATVAASLSQDGTAFTAAFANHASETNSLFVVYDASDKGAGTNGWAHVERLGTVTPETDSWTYPAPAGWGDSVKALRFVLSEVPYDYDYSLDFIRNADYKQRIVLSDFDLYMNYRVCVRMRTAGFVTGNPCVFSNRDTGGNVAPYFTLFAIGGSKWRFDYNDKSGSQQGTVKTENCDYAIEASSAGLYVNETLVESKTGTTTDIASKGRLEFFCGNTTASAMGNMNLRFNLYGAQVYDAPAGGNLLVNLVPMVKDGVAGMYDTVRDKFYFSDIVLNGTAYPFPIVENTRVESANPFFASTLVAVAEEGPTVFSPASSTTDATDYANPDGGILNGSATLTLSGDNDWGGKFAVSNGTLAAAFGQGLAATDALLLAPAGTLRSGTYGGYAGYAGRATAPLGTGSTPGAVNVASDGYWAFAAPDGGSLELDAGGEGAPIAISSDYRRFLFNGAAGAGTLTVANPLVSDDTPFKTLVIRTGFGKAELAGNVTGADAANPANGLTIDCYDLDTPSAGCDGRTVFLGSGNHFKTLQIRSGTHGFGEGAAATLDGNLNLYGGTFFATNATVALSGAADYISGLVVTTGAVDVAGGSFTAGHCAVGLEYTAGGNVGAACQAALSIDGEFTLDDKISSKSFGSMTVSGSAASEAVTFGENARVRMMNLNFYRRNIYQNGGAVVLAGNYGINDMGAQGTARYWLNGGTLTAACVKQAAASDKVSAPVAWFVFAGGTLVTPSNVKTPFFQDFSGTSAIQVQADKTSTFQVDYDTSVVYPLVHVNGSWKYAAADWLTAPAFTKTGAAALTLSGTSTYRCATDVAEGTLALAGGDAPGVLPATGVVRLTGGTLDLGGNAQTVKGLAGTAGAVVNGSLAVTDGIYPGGAGGVGSFSCGAALDGTLYVDVDAETGACDSIAVPSGSSLDLSSLDLVLPESIPSGVERLQVVSGAATGAFRSVANLPSGWEIAVVPSGVRARKVLAFVLTVR